MPEKADTICSIKFFIDAGWQNSIYQEDFKYYHISGVHVFGGLSFPLSGISTIRKDYV